MVYCLQNKCHAISTVCLQLRESVGYRYRRCVLCSYLEEALTHTVTHTTKAAFPIVSMTANAFEDDQKNALNARTNGHIAKLPDIQKPFQVLSELLK